MNCGDTREASSPASVVALRLAACGDCEHEYALDGGLLACRKIVGPNGRPCAGRFAAALRDVAAVCPVGKWATSAGAV